MATTYIKTADGWAIRTHIKDVYRGQTIAVTRRDGVIRYETVSRIISKNADYTIAAIGGVPRSRPVEAFLPADTQAFPYQLAGARRIIDIFRDYDGALLADEMGLGKSLQAILVARAIQAKRTLIICPAILRENWLREINRHWPTASVRIMRDGEVPANQVVIASYERAYMDSDVLKRQQWSFLIVDEAHRCKNARGKQSNQILGKQATSKTPTIRGIAQSAVKVLLLTGTPILARPIDAQPLLSVCSPEFATWNYLERYCDAREEWVSHNRKVWKFNGATNLGELNARLYSTVMVRRTKADVLPELPPKFRQIITLDSESVDSIIALEITAARETGWNGAEDIAEYALRMRPTAFAAMAHARESLGLAKVPYVIEHIRGILDESLDRKVIIFAHHHSVLDAIESGLPRMDGRMSIAIDGRTPEAERTASVERFQTDSKTRVAILGIHAAGVGITLTRADLAIFAELDWTPAIISQAEDRAHRIGQTSPVTVQHLVFARSLDAQIVRTLLAKQATIDAIL